MSPRRKAPPKPPVLGEVPDEEVRRYRGHWVAVKNGHVLFGARDQAAVDAWLDEHDVGDVFIVRIRGEDEPKIWTFLAREPRPAPGGAWSARRASDVGSE